MIKYTDDTELKEQILQALKESDGYCPCRIDHTPDTKRMCKEFRDMIKAGQEGSCHCGLMIFTKDKKENS